MQIITCQEDTMQNQIPEYEHAISITGLTKRYDGFTLRDVSLHVPKGCIMGFVGQNGAGKTTTIRSMLNMIPVDAGSISILGYDYKRQEAQLKESIGVVFDEMGFHKQFSPIELNKIFRPIYKNWDEDVFFSYLQRFALPPKRKCGKFSRGMQMKLQIAVALSHHAKLLIMDEPTSGLDPIVRNEMLDVFLEFVQEEDHTIFLSSHITSDLDRIADYITFINNGQILFSDEQSMIKEQHKMIRCTKEDALSIPPESVVGTRLSSFGAEVLIKNPDRVGLSCPSLLMEDATLDEIMIYYVCGMNKSSIHPDREVAE